MTGLPDKLSSALLCLAVASPPGSLVRRELLFCAAYLCGDGRFDGNVSDNALRAIRDYLLSSPELQAEHAHVAVRLTKIIDVIEPLARETAQ